MSLSPVKILLVDDERRNLDVLDSLLRGPEHELVHAMTADEALLLLLGGEFAVIVLDIQMPGMSGLELAALIKQRRRTQHIPIIFLTAYYQDDKDVIEGYDSGAVDYLTKPINPQILRSKIKVFVELFQKTRALAETTDALEVLICQRLRAEDALQRANAELEARVRDRTAALSHTNDVLRAREAALQKSEAQARAASGAKDHFLAALSHELRTPLNPVLLLASESAADPTLSDEVRADFETIRKNIGLEARLIDDLLDLTSISRGKLPIEPRAVDAHAALQNAIAIVRSDIDEKHLQLALDFAADEHTVWGDEVRLQQVCWNVLKNAVKFTPSGGRITVETRMRRGDGEITIKIADTGIGLTSEELGRVFEAFAQGEHASAGSSHRFGGLGLGLAISRMLVEMHGGRMSALSAGRDKGSSFVITLPLAHAGPSSVPWLDDKNAARGTASKATARPPSPNRRIRILLVDDHAPTRSTLVQLLGRRDFDVTAAGSVAEARANAQGRHLDLLISDIGLPDGGGCELLKDLRIGQPGLAGIALSGYGMEEDVARSRLAGFSEHIIKPVSIDALDAAIAAALREGETKEDPPA